ncbi:dCTP deaminase [Candidatus Gracilibacteria bacterium]|nr:dCTP deaminase [Candidatus Gracilibacteria bacterium]
MILADSEIKRRIQTGEIQVNTENDYDIISQIGPASLDFRLGHTFKYYRRKNQVVIDVRKGVEEKFVGEAYLEKDEAFILHPGDFILGATLESFSIPENLVARCEGRSSLGRLGIVIHSTAGFIDPGFSGTITLEMTNINEVPVAIYPGMRIGQLAFETLEGNCDMPYNKRKGSKYMGQKNPEASRIDRDLENK